MKITLLAICTLFVTGIYAQDSASVLFIGNSYTYYNDLPLMVQELANSQGDILYYDSQLAGGATFQYHASNSTTYNKINSEPWDYVVLQAQSQEPSFPDAQVNTETLPYAIQMADSVYANRFCSEVLFFMTWGRENGDPQWAPISTFEGMNSRLRNAYMRFADSVQGSVSPVGSAWAYVRETYPSINLYAGDGSHPSLEGSYLAACTFYASIFRKNPVGASYISTLDPTIAANLQSAAALTVLDSLDQWNLRPIWEHTQAEFNFQVNGMEVSFENGSTKAQGYYWNFGDGQNSTIENPTVTYATSGTYTVTLVAESPCDMDTIEYQITVSDAGLDELSASVQLQDHGNGLYKIESNTEIRNISVFDALGHLVVSKEDTWIDLKEETGGVYLIQVETKSGRKVFRVLR